ncbi:hypothetical protein D3C72_2037710 [compost metagenome]
MSLEYQGDLALDLGDPDLDLVTVGRHANGLLEHSNQVQRLQAHHVGQLLQGCRLVVVILELAAHLLHRALFASRDRLILRTLALEKLG